MPIKEESRATLIGRIVLSLRTIDRSLVFSVLSIFDVVTVTPVTIVIPKADMIIFLTKHLESSKAVNIYVECLSSI